MVYEYTPLPISCCLRTSSASTSVRSMKGGGVAGWTTHQCPLQRGPLRPGRPNASAWARSMPRRCKPSSRRPCKVSPTTCSTVGMQQGGQSASQSVSQSVFVAKRPQEAQPTPCKPRDCVCVCDLLQRGLSIQTISCRPVTGTQSMGIVVVVVLHGVCCFRP
jgi:hypothetical protein